MAETTKLSRLSHFRVTCPDGSEFTNKLYANGRHQSEVVVEVIKECQINAGVWQRTELTNEEIASVRVAPFFSDDGQSLPSGWRCDDKKNIYSEGLWEREQKVGSEPDAYNPGTVVQRVSRYLRFSSQEGPLDAVTFVAYMVVDSQVYTTRLSAENSCFDSSVTLQPIMPFRLSVSDLIEYRHNAVSAPDFYATVYYWTPPAGVVFVAQEGLDRPLNMQYEGDHFQTSYAYAKQGDGTPHKGGVVVNKEKSPVMREDVFKPYGYPVYNYHVPVDIRPTIMRAILVRSLALKVDVTRDSNSAWSLMDNFGNIHRFSLVPNADYFLRLEDYEFRPETNIRNFKIIFPDGLPTSNALYANGRHQCKVLIEATKEEYLPDGTWRAVPLTRAECNSATVTLYSVNDGQALPSGWSCDTSKNIYDSGLWTRGSEKNDPEKLAGMDYAGPGPLVEIIDRYMRVDPSRPIEPMRFMARIVVDGKVYTTYHSSGGEYVTITPTRPYTVKAAELISFPDLDAYNDEIADCDIYYWLLPSTLRFLVNKGLDRPLSMDNEGDYFTTCWSTYHSAVKRYLKAGVLVTKDSPELRIRMKDVHRHIYGGGDGTNPYIPFNKHNTMMRAVRLQVKNTTFTTGDTHTPWRLWDNHGCEHVYRLEMHENGTRILLKDF
ncbi:hypothetical protein [Pseudomonas sp. R3-52-08]|uniref:hypothetical protein n=1 Tax=Pseudomonas sp. R3-52-08 TaxID=1173284 RepID=UPI000F57506C|nr:hypothetical protein [Pseudomonas sp. R3-52-08]AZF19846.1 hypothetical protein C4J91_1080 [Pseudomonas sp. R3-52-08]